MRSHSFNRLRIQNGIRVGPRNFVKGGAHNHEGVRRPNPSEREGCVPLPRPMVGIFLFNVLPGMWKILKGGGPPGSATGNRDIRYIVLFIQSQSTH